MSEDIDNLEEKVKEIFDDLYHKMDKRIQDLSEQVRNNFIPNTEEKLKKNVFKTVFFSFLVGFIAGAIFTIFGLNRGKKK